MRINVFLFAVFVFMFLSCEDSRNVEYPILGTEIRNSLSLQLGSYFIYKDSSTTNLDSFWLDRPISMWVTNSLGDNHNQYIEVLGYHLINTDSLEINIATNGTGAGSGSYNITGDISGKQVTYYSTHFLLNSVESNVTGYHVFTSFYDSISINGKYYKNVLKSFNKYDSLERDVFYSFQDGIVKFTSRTDTTYNSWELVHSNLIH